MITLVIGASGFLGAYLLKNSKKIGKAYGTGLNHLGRGLIRLDILDKGEVQRIFRRIKPDIVFVPAARPNVDYCEEHPLETRRVNVEGLKNVVDSITILSKPSKLVFFSTDYLFNGKNGPYVENAKPHPINEYGRQKLAVERYITKKLQDYIIVRTTGVFGWEKLGKNFVVSLIKDNKEGRIRKIPVDQMGNPTYALNLTEILLDLIKRKKRGIFNIAGEEFMTRYAFAILVADIFDLDKKFIQEITTKELGQKGPRPLKAGLIIDKIKKTTSIPVLSAREGLIAMRRERNEK